MHCSTLFAFLFALLSHLAPVVASPTAKEYIDWRTFSANGVNLGGWLVQESGIDTTWWATHAGNATDEWGLCANLGSKCGPTLEKRYATWITNPDIDILASAGIKLLRIPTTYAAWVKVPGSQLYTGGQTSYLRKITDYAIEKHNMHIIIDIHSLPGGINGQGIGEANGHYGWYNNATALDYSYQAVESVIAFIQSSKYPQHFTVEPINEPVDNRDFSAFGSPLALSDAGAQYLTNFYKGVLARVGKINARIPVMFQDGFKGEPYFSPSFSASANLVFDIHNYYFAGRPVSSSNVTSYICADAKLSAGDGKFPTFVGEWSIQTLLDNKLSKREDIFDTAVSAFNRYTRGNAYWTAKFVGNGSVNGAGTQKDYWNLETFYKLGFLPYNTPKNCCQ